MASFNLDGGGGTTDTSTSDDEEEDTSTSDTGGGGGTSTETQFTSGTGETSTTVEEDSTVEEDTTTSSGSTGGTSGTVEFTSGTGETATGQEDTQETESDTSDGTQTREADFTPREREVRDEFVQSRENVSREDVAGVEIDEESGRATIRFREGTARRVAQRELAARAGSTGAMFARDTTRAGVSLSDFQTGGLPDATFAEREEAGGGAGTARDVRFTPGETDQPSPEEILERRIAMENPGLTPSDVQVRRRDGEFQATVTGTPEATEEELEQLEREAETASVTVPDVVPFVGGTTIERQFRDVELEQTEEGTVEVTEQERFGDFDINVPFTDREFEELTGEAGDRLVSGGQQVGDALAEETVRGGRFSFVQSTPAFLEEQVTGDTELTERFTRGVPVGAANIGSQALNLPQEAAEFSVEAGRRTARGEARDFAGDVGSAAAGKGVVVAQEASQDPAGFAGQLAGSAVLSAGAIGAAGRFGGPRTARATSVTIQPGEELAIAAARRGAIPTRAATAVPGVRRSQIRAEAEEFLQSDRGQLELTGPRSRSESREETTTITAEDLDTPLGDPSRPSVRARAEEAPEPAPDDPTSPIQRRRRRAQQSEVTRTTTSRIEGIDDERPSPTLEERVPPGFRQRQEAAQRQEVTVGETELERDARLFDTIQQAEVTAGQQQRLAEAQASEVVGEEGLEASAVETGVVEREALREEVGVEQMQETRQELSQESRLETRQEVGVESRSELGREVGVEARREIGIEADVDLDLRPDRGEGRRRRRRDDFTREFEFGVASPEEVLQGLDQDLDVDLGDN